MFFLFVLFPYLTPFKTNFDTQPWALLFAIMYTFREWFLYKHFTIPRSLKLPLIFACYSVCSLAIFWIFGLSDLGSGLRSLTGYLSLFFIPFAAYKTFMKQSSSYFIFAVFASLMVGLIQKFIDPLFAIDILPRISTGGIRGVTGLTPEPAWYGRWGIFCLILNDYFYITGKYNRRTYIITMGVLALQIVISFSGMGFALMLFYAILKIIIPLVFDRNTQNIRQGIITGILFLVVLSLFVFHPTLQQTRAGVLISELRENPILLTRYTGVTLRLLNPLRAFYGGLIYTKGLGFGIAQKTDFYEHIPGWLDDLLVATGYSDIKWGGRVRGGLVSLVYEFGILGLLYFISLIMVFFRSISSKKFLARKRCYFIVGSLVALSSMFFEGSLSFPLFGYIMGIHIYIMGKGNITENAKTEQSV